MDTQLVCPVYKCDSVWITYGRPELTRVHYEFFAPLARRVFHFTHTSFLSSSKVQKNERESENKEQSMQMTCMTFG